MAVKRPEEGDAEAWGALSGEEGRTSPVTIRFLSTFFELWGEEKEKGERDQSRGERGLIL